MTISCPGKVTGRIAAACMLLAAANCNAATLVLNHAGPVSSVAFSSDGTRVLTGSLDATAVLWNAATGASVRSFTGHTGYVTSVALSPDGTQVLTGSGDHTAKIWNTSTGAEMFTLTGHTQWVSSVAFSPDGAAAATAGWDGVLKLWNASTGVVIRTISAHPGLEIHAVAFSPDGTRVITGAQDGTMKLWNPATGALVRSYLDEDENAGMIMSVRYSPDGTQLVTGSYDNKTRIWDAATGAVVRRMLSDENATFSAVFSPDGKKILTGGWEGFAKLWDAPTGALEQTISGHAGSVTAVAFSPDGKKVLTGSEDWTARLQDIPFSGTIVINGNRSATNSVLVSLALTWHAAPSVTASRMRFSDDGAHWTPWEPLAATRSHTLPAGDGYKTVRVQYRDTAGGLSAAVSDYIRLDMTVPTGSIAINNGASTTATRAVVLKLNWFDGTGTGVVRMRFSDDGAHWSTWEPVWTTRAHTLPLATLGYQTVRVQYLDGANNYSAVCSDYIKLVAP